MPRRQRNQKRNQRGKQKRSQAAANANSNKANNGSLALQRAGDANDSGGSDMASLLRRKIEELEQSERRKQWQHLLKDKRALNDQVKTIRFEMEEDCNIANSRGYHQSKKSKKQKEKEKEKNKGKEKETENGAPDTETKMDENSQIEFCQKYLPHFNRLAAFVENLSEIFYDLVSSENHLRRNSGVLADQNDRLEKLCRSLKHDNALLRERIEEIQDKEKQWHAKVQNNFQNSLNDIRNQISNHEAKYKAVVEENDQLRTRIQEFVEYEKRRTADFKKYQEHAHQLEKIYEAEKSNLRRALDHGKAQMKKLSSNLENQVEMNDALSKKCKEYEKKFEAMSKTMADSSQCIDQFKSMKSSVLKQNKELNAQLKDIMSKYTQLNAFNDLLQKSYDTTKSKCETLTNLCRRLQMENKKLRSNTSPTVPKMPLPALNPKNTQIPAPMSSNGAGALRSPIPDVEDVDIAEEEHLHAMPPEDEPLLLLNKPKPTTVPTLQASDGTEDGREESLEEEQHNSGREEDMEANFGPDSDSPPPIVNLASTF